MNSTLQIEQAAHASERYAQRVNREWVRLLDWLQMSVRCERCVGVELFPEDGRRILDFLSGYCVQNVGHNHPDVVQALQSELERCGPAMIQTHVGTGAARAPQLEFRLAPGGSNNLDLTVLMLPFFNKWMTIRPSRF